jgi:hypothetical protein
MTFAISVTLFGILAAPIPRVSLAWIEPPRDFKLSEMERDESRELFAETVETSLIARLKAEGYEASGSKFIRIALNEQRINLGDPKKRTIPAFEAAGAQTDAPILCLLDVRKITQKNKDPMASLDKPNQAASDTQVELSIWFLIKKDQSLVKFGDREPLKGSMGGPYLGTTSRKDYSGDPTGVSIAIRQEHIKRLKLVAGAVWQASRQIFLDTLRQDNLDANP